jgi:hypothetical protein
VFQRPCIPLERWHTAKIPLGAKTQKTIMYNLRTESKYKIVSFVTVLMIKEKTVLLVNSQRVI